MLTGKRIILRAPEREDLKSFHKWQNDEEVMMLARSMPDHGKSMGSIEAEMEKERKGVLPRRQSQQRAGEEARIQRRRSATRPGFLQQPVSRQRRSWAVEEPVRQATPQLIESECSMNTPRPIA